MTLEIAIVIVLFMVGALQVVGMGMLAGNRRSMADLVRRLEKMEGGMVWKDVCEKTHEPLNFYAADHTRLCERVAVLEYAGGIKNKVS